MSWCYDRALIPNQNGLRLRVRTTYDEELNVVMAWEPKYGHHLQHADGLFVGLRFPFRMVAAWVRIFEGI